MAAVILNGCCALVHNEENNNFNSPFLLSIIHVHALRSLTTSTVIYSLSGFFPVGKPDVNHHVHLACQFIRARRNPDNEVGHAPTSTRSSLFQLAYDVSLQPFRNLCKTKHSWKKLFSFEVPIRCESLISENLIYSQTLL